MPSVGLLPVTEPGEVKALLRSLPLAVDGEGFTKFVLGFPRRYLTQTPAVELVRHFALTSSLGPRAVVSSVAREPPHWKLCLVARDRRFLFARIAGALSRFGMDILQAEAFANASELVLDTFVFDDRGGHFHEDGQRRRFQVFLEDAVEGKAALEVAPAAPASLRLTWDSEAHPQLTRLLVEGPDRFGLLYGLSNAMGEAGYDIEMAYISTAGGQVRDEFYLARGGAKLDEAMRSELDGRLSRLGRSA